MLDYGPPYTYPQSSHFFTVEEQGGSDNTVILALSGAPAHASAYDDDDGVGLMSWIHTPAACTSYCKVLVGVRWYTEGSATFMWDEDIHYNDSDGDGASNALEAALTTDPYSVDTDEDGLGDMAETMGVDTADGLLRLPYYGADAKQPDVFVEADWLACDINNPLNVCGLAPGDPDRYRFKSTWAWSVGSIYYDPDYSMPADHEHLVHTHVDIGLSSSSHTRYGAWGGATRQAENTKNKCEWGSDSRSGYFHFARIFEDGGQSIEPGTCFDASNQSAGGTFAHELGHNLNLSHGGKQSGTVNANCKPNYRSIMNYAINAVQLPMFSAGEFLGVDLNPEDMDEYYGLGTTDPSLLAHIDRDNTDSKFGFYAAKWVGVYLGWIDWNRDGLFQSTVRAAPTWAAGKHSCEVGSYQADRNVWANRTGSALAWAHTWSGGRLFWFARNPSNNHIEYRVAATFPENCGNPPSANCKTNWSPSVALPWGTDVPTNASGAPAVARYTYLNGSDRLLLAYPPSIYGRPMYKIFDPFFGTWTGQAWMPGAITTQGELAATTYSDAAYVYGIGANDNRLYKWSLSSQGVWSGPTAQVWSNGTPVLAKYGVGLTSGQTAILGGTPTQQLFAAIPLQAPDGKLVFAWTDPITSNAWTAMPDSEWDVGIQYARAQPGLAYAPLDPQSPSAGRFFLAWSPPVNAEGKKTGDLMAMTQGNDPIDGHSRELRWNIPVSHLETQWTIGAANTTLLYDMDYDTNVRAAFTKEDDDGSLSLTFEPYADGIFPNIIGDQDDYPVIRENLDAKIHP
ncbi:MAG: hypothetical protein AUK47_09910 [Deltaproteobacteria bacterium CG2_30_63_29]|nr:MAG: hypothetical protein AUK47_09910 [Deltaproteobacteria bacterium CG2_30_63_29]